jgi:hypothetical protein
MTERNDLVGFMGTSQKLRFIEQLYTIWRELPDEEKTVMKLTRISGLSMRKAREEYLPILQDMEREENGGQRMKTITLDGHSKQVPVKKRNEEN